MPAKRPAAFTLVEILLVLLLLGILGAALVQVPRSTSDGNRVAAAAAEVAAALRFARSEAMRTAEPHGVRVSEADHRVRVYHLDTVPDPPVEEFTVLHPIDKKLYDLDLHQAPLTAGVIVDRSQFRFGGLSTDYESVAFDADGLPRSPTDLTLMDIGRVDVQAGTVEQTVRVEPVTGRVTIQ